MAKDKLTDYSATNSLNTDVGGVNIDEGMLPSDVNNALREVMTHLKDFAEGTQAVNNIKFAGATTTGDINFGDNVKAVFGDNDFEIVHTGTNTNLRENGTGNLNVWGDDIYFYNSAGTETKASYLSNGAVTLYYDNAAKLATTATGADITGVLTADGLTVDTNTLHVDATNNRVGIGTASVDNKLHLEHAGSLYLQIENTSTANKFYLGNSGGNAILESTGAYSMNFKTNSTEAARIDSSQNFLVSKTAADISVVGVEARANGSLIATKDNDKPLLLNRLTSDGDLIELRKAGTVGGNIGIMNGNNLYIANNADNSGLQFGTGAITPSYDLAAQNNSVDLGSSSTKFKNAYFNGTVYADQFLGQNDTNTGIAVGGNDVIQFSTGGSERARVDASGNLLINHTATGDWTNTSGAQIRATGLGIFTQSASSAIIANRLSTDGTILDLRKDGSAVGSIESDAGRIRVISNGSLLLRQNGTTQRNIVFSSTYFGTDTAGDATVDLGRSAGRFKDLYLSNSVNITTATNGTSIIDLGDTADDNIGRIAYDNSVDAMYFKTNNSEAVRIDSIGRVLLGTTSTIGGVLQVYNNSGTGRIINTRSYSTANQYHHSFQNNSGTTVGNISVSTTATSYNSASDYRLKTAVNYDWDATSRLKQLKPARFEWIADGDDAVPVDGFLAHEVADVVPEAISGTKDAVDADGNPVYQGIDQSKLVPLLVKTIQELEARIATLEAK